MTSGTTGSGNELVVVTLRPDEEEWGGRTDRWRADVLELQQELERAVRSAVVPAPGGAGKGIDLIEVVVAMGSAGVFTASVEAMKAWLGHGRRSIIATWRVTRDGREETGDVRIDASNVDSDVLGQVAGEVFKGPR